MASKQVLCEVASRLAVEAMVSREPNAELGSHSPRSSASVPSATVALEPADRARPENVVERPTPATLATSMPHREAMTTRAPPSMPPQSVPLATLLSRHAIPVHPSAELACPSTVPAPGCNGAPPAMPIEDGGGEAADSEAGSSGDKRLPWEGSKSQRKRQRKIR